MSFRYPVGWLGCSLLALAAPALAQPKGSVGTYSDVTITGAVLEPTPVQVGEDLRLAELIRVPEGFRVAVAGRGFGNTRMLAVSAAGHVYATRRTEGDVIRLDDGNGDGVFEGFTRVASRAGMHGIAFDGDTVYLATVNDVYRAAVAPDGSFGELLRIIDDLPDGGQHPNRTLGMGPDGRLYISAGSTCNACAETNPESATLLRAMPDGSGRTIFASGLRNTIGFGWEPATGRLWGFDHGIDWLGDAEQQEELNLIEKGGRYGWPYVYDFSKPNPQDNPPDGITVEGWARMSTEPRLGYIAHSAPMQMLFYTGGAFPDDYRGDAFVAMRGSWNRRPPSGYEVVRIDFEGGEPRGIAPFATGFLLEHAGGGYGFLARLAGIAQDRDGSLLLADDFNGTIYRISHSVPGPAETAVAAPPPDAAPPSPATDIAMMELDAPGGLDVVAPFSDGGAIPTAHAAEGQDASPALSWSGAPEGTASYVVLMEDPDAQEPKPFVHWLAWDIPPGTMSLREGLPTAPVLQDPRGMRQGSNSKGQNGYSGPRPPLGEPAHRYHLQVFALDVPQLPVAPGADRADVLAAMHGHVLAAGAIVGTYERPRPEQARN